MEGEKLAVRRKEAARMLSMSERWLQQLTAAGEIPCIRQGRAVLYSIDALRAWLQRRQAAGGTTKGD